MAMLSLKAAIVGLLALATQSQALCSRDEKQWITVWGTMPQLVEPQNLPPEPFVSAEPTVPVHVRHTNRDLETESDRVFRDTTIRQTVKVSLETDELRLQISNVFGGSDLPITAVSVALPEDPSKAGGSAIQPSTATNVTFSGSPSFNIPNGARIISDPIDIFVEAESILAISIYTENGQKTNEISGHPGSRTTSWLVHGNHVADEDFEDATSTDHWYLINTLEAKLTKGTASTVAIVGDSITDGRGSTTNANNRWPDQLLARMQSSNSSEPSRSIAILNQAAGGNRILGDGLGPNALGRIDRDVLTHTGVKYAIIFIGVNDIGTTATEREPQEAIEKKLIQAYKQMASRIRDHGIAVFGATITPMSGPGQGYGHPERERTRQAVNEWIRTSGTYDAVIDFDEMVRDPENEEQLADEYNDGDYLHLSPEGYKAMAEGIDLSIFN